MTTSDERSLNTNKRTAPPRGRMVLDQDNECVRVKPNWEIVIREMPEHKTYPCGIEIRIYDQDRPSQGAVGLVIPNLSDSGNALVTMASELLELSIPGIWEDMVTRARDQRREHRNR